MTGRWKLAGFVAGVILCAVLGAADSSAGTKHLTKLRGGTAYFADPLPLGAPHYIFPFANLAAYDPEFQPLMYRPLYWFGNGSQPTLNLSLSLSRRPAYSNHGTEVTMKLKSYKFSNGEKVTAQDVVFWLNILKVERYNWAGYMWGYVSGTMPDDLASVTAPNPTTVVVKTTGPVNPLWFTSNELSQITPFPMAWDISATGQKAGSRDCGRASYASVTVRLTTSKTGKSVEPLSPQAKSCAAVYTYLSKESGYDPANPKAPNTALDTFATNPLWQIVDGPWKLSSFDANGNASFVPNPSYSGPVKPTLSKFVELSFTSDKAEFDALVDGKVTVGYLPMEDVTSPAKSPTVPGPNNPRLTNFKLTPVYPWGVNYLPYNFRSTGDGGEAGKIIRQLYFRQAFQLLIDQPAYIEKIFKGYGIPAYGPVPVLPKNIFATAYEQHNPYAYNVEKAQQLLTENGWSVKPGGETICSDAAKCGVPAGTPLDFSILDNYGLSDRQLMAAEQSSWAQAGIRVNVGGCGLISSACTGDLTVGGWLYWPDYYPSGEEIFQTGANWNWYFTK
jgi:peptide/nickel transport system substrate-binding protein